MVEGPGATRNSKKVQLAVSQRVVSDDNAHPQHLISELSTFTLKEAFSIGKELFLIFTSSIGNEEVALRLHFGMNGSLYARKVNSTKSGGNILGGVPLWKQQRKKLSLRLHFGYNNDVTSTTRAIIEAWDTTVTYPVSVANARNKYMDNTARDVCSEFFCAQDFFISLRQNGNDMIISDALLNQDICPGVGNIIKIESLHRSKLDPRRRVRSLTDQELRRIIRHTRKYSMDWLKSGSARTKLVYNQTVCGSCRGMTVKMQKIGGEAINDSDTTTARTDSNKGHAFMSRVTFWCITCQPYHQQSTLITAPFNEKSICMQTIAPTIIAATNNPLNKRQPRCPQHGQQSIKLSRVRKESQNTLRIFLMCKKKGCQYFQWADSKFPNCKCNRRVILRVSKTERSGGKWFMCCASGSNKSGNSNDNSCQYFEWAKDEHLAHIRSLLTPLL